MAGCVPVQPAGAIGARGVAGDARVEALSQPVHLDDVTDLIGVARIGTAEVEVGHPHRSGADQSRFDGLPVVLRPQHYSSARARSVSPVRVSAIGATGPVERIEGGHVLVGQREVEDLGVLLDPLAVG